MFKDSKKKRFFVGFVFFSIVGTFFVNAAQQTDVYVSGEEGYHTYRIPALITSQKGTLLAFCEGRKNNRGDHGDIDLLLKRSTDGGKTWTKAQVVYEEGDAKNVTIGNPCPVVDKETGTIWLSFCRDNRDVFVVKSVDDGKSWSAPVKITKQVKGPGWSWYATGPGVGIQLTRGAFRGRLVIPCDHREKVGGRWVKFSHVFFSDDSGETWGLGDSVHTDTDECQVVELANGSLMINMRNYAEREGKQKGKGRMRAVAISKDGGGTWPEFTFAEKLIEPVCQASFLRFLRSDVHGLNRVLFSNPASKNQRHMMTVRMSRDEGKTWPVSKVLHKGPAAYSCLSIQKDMRVACLFEAGKGHAYEKIVCSRFSLNWLTDGKEKLSEGFKIGACDWTIGKRCNPDSLSVAKELGLDGVQVDFGGPTGDDKNKLQLFDNELQNKFLKTSEKLEVEIGSLAMGILNGIPLKSDPRTEGWVEEAIKTAEAMKIKVILLAFFGKGDLKNDSAGIDKVVEKLKRLAPKAEKAGVVLGIESWLSASELLDIIKRVGSPNIQVYYDVGNSNKKGYDIYKEICLLGNEHICEFHAKDYKDIFGKGAVDFKRVRKVMDKIGYRSWIHVESVMRPLGPLKTVQRDAEYLRTVLPYMKFKE